MLTLDEVCKMTLGQLGSKMRFFGGILGRLAGQAALCHGEHVQNNTCCSVHSDLLGCFRAFPSVPYAMF